MADLSDVESALGVLIGACLYPTPPDTPEAASPVAGLPVLVMGGWPSPQALDTMMAAGKACVSIYAPNGAERNTTRYADDWHDGPLQPVTRTLSKTGQAVTIGGSSTDYPQNLAIVIARRAYIVQALTQSPSDLAVAFATLISQDVPGVTAVGAVLTFPATTRIGDLRTGTVGQAFKEVRRSERQFQISVWAPSPASRSAVTEAFDPVLSDTPRLLLTDGQLARMTYRSSADDDFAQKQRIFRRNIFYTVEYAVTRSEQQTQIIVLNEVVTDSLGGTLFELERPVSTPPAPPALGVAGQLDLSDPNQSALIGH